MCLTVLVSVEFLAADVRWVFGKVIEREVSFEAGRNRVRKGVDEPVVGLAFPRVCVVVNDDVVFGEGFAAEVAVYQSERVVIAGFQHVGDRVLLRNVKYIAWPPARKKGQKILNIDRLYISGYDDHILNITNLYFSWIPIATLQKNSMN